MAKVTIAALTMISGNAKQLGKLMQPLHDRTVEDEGVSTGYCMWVIRSLLPLAVVNTFLENGSYN